MLHVGIQADAALRGRGDSWNRVSVLGCSLTWSGMPLVVAGSPQPLPFVPPHATPGTPSSPFCDSLHGKRSAECARLQSRSTVVKGASRTSNDEDCRAAYQYTAVTNDASIHGVESLTREHLTPASFIARQFDQLWARPDGGHGAGNRRRWRRGIRCGGRGGGRRIRGRPPQPLRWPPSPPRW